MKVRCRLISIAAWWEPKEKLISIFVIPLFCFIFASIKDDSLLSLIDSSLIKSILLTIRPDLFIFLVICYGIAALLAVLVYIFGEKNQDLKDRLRNAEDKIDLLQNNIRELFDGILIKVHKAISCSDNSTRISLYYSCGDGFIMIGRYCPDPTLNVAGRGFYPCRGGVIGLGWKNGWAFDDFKGKSADERIIIFRDKYHMSDPENLSMNPVQIAALRLTSSSEIASQKNLGVIVLETMTSALCKEDDIRSVFKEHAEHLACSIRVLRDFIPNPEAASSIEN